MYIRTDGMLLLVLLLCMQARGSSLIADITFSVIILGMWLSLTSWLEIVPLTHPFLVSVGFPMFVMLLYQLFWSGRGMVSLGIFISLEI